MESWSLLTSRKLFFVGQHGKRYKQCGSLPSYFSLWSIILTAFDVHCCIGCEDLPRNAVQRSSRCHQLQLPRHSALQRHPEDPWWRLSAMETVTWWMNSRFHRKDFIDLHGFPLEIDEILPLSTMSGSRLDSAIRFVTEAQGTTAQRNSYRNGLWHWVKHSKTLAQENCSSKHEHSP